MSAPDILPIFATPSNAGTVTLGYLRAWTNTVWLLKDHGIKHGRIDRAGGGEIDKVRCKLAQEFLDGPGTHLFFIDDDIGGYPPEKVLEFVMRPEPILAGVYPKKMETPDWPVSLSANGDTGELITDQGLYLAQWCGAGFLCIKREVIEALVKHAPRFKDLEAEGRIGDYPLLFKSGIGYDGMWTSEDVSFLTLARDHGYDLWIDPDINFHHRGGKTWTGRLADHLDTFREKAKLVVAKTKEPA